MLAEGNSPLVQVVALLLWDRKEVTSCLKGWKVLQCRSQMREIPRICIQLAVWFLVLSRRQFSMHLLEQKACQVLAEPSWLFVSLHLELKVFLQGRERRGAGNTLHTGDLQRCFPSTWRADTPGAKDVHETCAKRERLRYPL